MSLSQSERDSRRDSTLTRIGVALLDLLRRDAKKHKTTIRERMESILRKSFKVKK